MSFTEFVEDYKVGDEYPGELQLAEISLDHKRPFELDFLMFYEFNMDLATRLLNEPETTLTEFLHELQSKFQIRTGDYSYYEPIRVTNYPEILPIREISHEHIGKLIQIEGIITQIGQINQVMTKTAFRCLECGTVSFILQNGQFMQYPRMCSAQLNAECSGGRGFDVEGVKSEFKAVQQATIQENPDKVPSGLLPRSFKVELAESLNDTVKPGERVKIIGALKTKQKRKKDPDPVMNVYLTVNNILQQDNRASEVEVTEQDIQWLKEQAKHPNHLDQVAKSIAPSLYGLTTEKKAIALQQCEGVSREIYGERVRGQSHILLAGDPGEGKSRLLDYAALLNPRSIKVAGRGATAAGLTATVTQDKESGEWVLMAGAMVLADGGIVCADEFEKMRNEDRSAMHPAMEQQKIQKNAAGINAELNTRCSVLAACNPKGGRWVPQRLLMENIKLPPPLISRFDLIFVLRNERSLEEEMRRARHVITLRTSDEAREAPFTLEQLKKLFAYARTIEPTIPEEVSDKLANYYHDVTKASMGAKSLPISVRQLEGLIRLTEASTKLHLRDTATMDDADNAIMILNESLIQSGIDPETGKIDVRIYSTGLPSSVADKLMRLVDVVNKLSSSNIEGNYVPDDYLINWLHDNWKMTEDEGRKLIGLAQRDGILYQPKFGAWKVA